jgi:lysine 2,3-aminomutase
LSLLERVFQLSDDERDAVARHNGSLPVGITPYYASLLNRENPEDGLRRTHIPVGQEYLRTPGEADDPLGEDHDAAVPGLVHRYPDRVLFLATGFCSTYCRYCTRSRMVGEAGGEYSFSKSQWEKAFAYLEAHTEIRDVLRGSRSPSFRPICRASWSRYTPPTTWRSTASRPKRCAASRPSARPGRSSSSTSPPGRAVGWA